MKRIDSPNARQNLNGTGKNGFSANTDLNGQDATYLTPEWCNQVQEEIAGVIEGFGVSLNPAQKNQMFTVLQAKLSAFALQSSVDSLNITYTNALNALTNALQTNADEDASQQDLANALNNFYNAFNPRLNSVEASVNNLTPRLSTVENKLTNAQTRLNTVEGDINGINTALAAIQIPVWKSGVAQGSIDGYAVDFNWRYSPDGHLEMWCVYFGSTGVGIYVNWGILLPILLPFHFSNNKYFISPVLHAVDGMSGYGNFAVYPKRSNPPSNNDIKTNSFELILDGIEQFRFGIAISVSGKAPAAQFNTL